MNLYSSTRCALLFLAILFCSAIGVGAQPTSQNALRDQTTLRVATRDIAPFMFHEANARTGFSAELWKAIGAKLKVQTQWETYDSVKSLLGGVQKNQADIGIAAISITSEREKKFDFSQPMFNSGLQILVRDQNGDANMIAGLLSVFSPALWRLLGFVLLIVLIPAHIIWLVERTHPNGIIENRRYFPGIFKAIWWSAGTLGAQADEMPRSAIGRAVAVIWMFSGIIFVAYFTAVVTASLTVQQLQGDIQSPNDLPGKRVATLSGSTSSAFLRDKNVAPIEYSKIDDAYSALLENKVEAVVFDSPVLLYYATRGGRGQSHVVGTIFRKEDYGIVFPRGSKWRKPVNEALLDLREDGTYQELYDKWFASESGN